MNAGRYRPLITEALLLGEAPAHPWELARTYGDGGPSPGPFRRQGM